MWFILRLEEVGDVVLGRCVFGFLIRDFELYFIMNYFGVDVVFVGCIFLVFEVFAGGGIRAFWEDAF